jgi:hypothetical protein
MPATTQSVREARLRRQAHRRGCSISKSRIRTPHLDDMGGYRLLDHRLTSSRRWSILAGESFELDLDDVERILTS